VRRGLYVTGAASFVAGALIPAARKRGWRAGGVDLAPLVGEGFSRGDIADPDLADLMPPDLDAVVHLAGLTRDADCRGRSRDCFAANVVGSLNVAQAAQRRGARHLVFASTEWVYDRPDQAEGCDEDIAIDGRRLQAEYALSKLTAEQALRQHCAQAGLPLTVLRFGIIYGERDNNWGAVESLVHQVATTTQISVGARATARRYVHVDDIADAICTAIAGGDEAADTFNVVGPRLVSLGEVIEIAATLLDRQPTVIEQAPERPSIRRIRSDKAERVLGWRADIDIETGIARFIRHLSCSADPAAMVPA